jgi:hypothetical protein
MKPSWLMCRHAAILADAAKIASRCGQFPRRMELPPEMPGSSEVGQRGYCYGASS